VNDAPFTRLSVSDVIPSTRERQMGFIKSSLHREEVGSRKESGMATAVAEPGDAKAWRNEIANRVQAHRAKRKKFDPDSSLSLGFETAVEVADEISETAVASLEPAPVIDEESYEEPEFAEQSHTFDVMAEENAEPAYEPPAPATPATTIYDRMAAQAEARRKPAERDAEDNIIEFPKPAVPQNLFGEELAEPITTPRILDVPEEELHAEAHVEEVVTQQIATVFLDTPAELPEWAQNYEEDDYAMALPIQVAPLGPRILCGVMDAVLVLTAAALFALIVLSMAKFVPQGKAATAIAVLLPATLWAVYHYVFLVFGGITPGMLMSQLELSSFEGCVPTKRTRATRAAAMVLSCMSIGLGFAWAVFDEDSLGWHDRITRTYLRQS
jgi:hypothetical protein